MARAFSVQHKPDSVRAGSDGRIHILFTRQAANLDAGALGKKLGRCHGNPS
jgi:hypothetical protein